MRGRRRHGGLARPVRWRGAPPRPRADPRRAARASAGSTASSTSAWPRRRCSSGPAPPSTSVVTQGLAAGMGFTYRDPDRSTDPRRAVPGARSIVVAARSYLADDEPPRPPGVAGAGRPVRVGRPLRPAAGRAAGDRPPAAGRRPPGRRLRRRQLDRRSRGRLPRRARLVRQERQPAGARRRQLVRARLRRHHGRRCRSRTDAGRRRLRLVPALPRRLPDRGDRRARRDRRQPLPRLGAATPGCHPGRPPAGGRRPPLRLRRLPRGVPADRPPRPAPPPTAGRGRRGVGRRARPARRRRRRRCSSATGAGTSPTAIRAGCGATRSWCSATRRRPGRPRGRAPRWPATPPGDDDAAGRARPLGAAARLAERTVAARDGRRSRRREAPARHERLPAEDRRHPVAAVGVVATAAARSFAVLTSPYAGAAAFDSAQPFRIERTPEPVLLPHPWMVRRIDELAREVGADLVVLDPAVPLGLVGPSLELPYDVVLHGAEVTVPGRLPGTRQALGNVLRRARHVVSAGEYAAREAERAAGRSLPVTVVPPGVDVERFQPLDDGRARRGARRRSACPSTPSWSCRSPGSCRARASTWRSRPPRCSRRAGPTSCWRSPAAGATSGGCARLAAERRGAGAVPRPRRQRPPAGRCTAAPTCSRWRAASGGAGSSRRASASCSSRPRRAGCRRSPATPAGRPRRSTTA